MAIPHAPLHVVYFDKKQGYLPWRTAADLFLVLIGQKGVTSLLIKLVKTVEVQEDPSTDESHCFCVLQIQVASAKV